MLAVPVVGTPSTPLCGRLSGSVTDEAAMSSNRDVAASSLRTKAVSGRYGALTGTAIEMGVVVALLKTMLLLILAAQIAIAKIDVDMDLDEGTDDTS